MWQSTPVGPKVTEGSGAMVESPRLRNIHAEFVVAKPRADVRMRRRIHVRVDPQRKPDSDAQFLRDGVDFRQFAFRLAVEVEDALTNGQFDLAGRLANPGEDDTRRVAPGPQHTVQLPPRDDVEPASRPGQQRENGLRRVCLHGIADHVRRFPKCVVVGAIGVENRLCRIDVTGRPRRLGYSLQVDLLTVEFSVAIPEHQATLITINV